MMPPCKRLPGSRASVRAIESALVRADVVMIWAAAYSTVIAITLLLLAVHRCCLRRSGAGQRSIYRSDGNYLIAMMAPTRSFSRWLLL
jgi:hypothetical protein